MANEKKQQQTAAPEQGKKRSGMPRRLFTLVLILAAVLVVVVLSTMEDGKHFASLRRWLMYGDSSETGNLYTYAADQSNQYGRLGEDLLVVTPNMIRLLSDDGTVLYDLQVGMTAPRLSVGTERAVVCDVGGDTLYVLDSSGIIETKTLDRGLCYYTARINSSDYLAVVSQKSGFKSSVAVYDKEGEQLFHFDSYESYVGDAVVTQDGSTLVAVALNEMNGAFSSTLLAYDLASAQRTGECSIRDGLTMDFVVNGDRVISLCDKRLSITTLGGETLLDRAYGNLYLHNHALTGEDFCALLLGRYQAGNIGQLTTYDLQGQEIATMEIGEEVLDLSAAGEYLAVLYSNSLVIYTRDLTEYARLDSTDYAGQVQMEEAGTALVITGTSAWRFRP